MIDTVEARVIARQITETLHGRQIAAAVLGERRRKSMRDAYLLRCRPEEFRARLEGARLTDAYAKHRHVCLETDGGHGLHVWDVYGRILHIASGERTPGEPPISLVFEDSSRLVVVAGVWGAMRLATVEELRALRDASDPDILDPSAETFTIEALQDLFAHEEFAKSNVKQVLGRIGRPGVAGMVGAYGQEALYRARIHPKMRVQALSEEVVAALHRAMRSVTLEALEKGGRATERDLFDRPGGFVPTVGKATEGTPCPACGALIQGLKLGGAGLHYICPGCQAL